MDLWFQEHCQPNSGMAPTYVDIEGGSLRHPCNWTTADHKRKRMTNGGIGSGSLILHDREGHIEEKALCLRFSRPNG